MADLTRTLKDYRPQHDRDCALNVYDKQWPYKNGGVCTCGLSALLTLEQRQISYLNDQLLGLTQRIGLLQADNQRLRAALDAVSFLVLAHGTDEQIRQMRQALGVPRG